MSRSPEARVAPEASGIDSDQNSGQGQDAGSSVGASSTGCWVLRSAVEPLPVSSIPPQVAATVDRGH
eukprot:1419530-Prymnesium_polylepis.1